MLYRAIPDGKNYRIELEFGAQGVAELVGARWRRAEQAYIASPAQRRDLELLLDAGFVGPPQQHYGGAYMRALGDFDPEAYCPAIERAVDDRREAVEIARQILNPPAPRPRNHPELAL
jgi:glycine/D-amino acid oxidase-like deaminating enzyme